MPPGFFHSLADSLVNALGVRAYDEPGRDPRRLAYAGLERLAARSEYKLSTLDQDAVDKLSITCSWVFADLTLISRRCTARGATLEVKRVEGEDKVSVPNHPFERLMESPNDLMPGRYMRNYLYQWWLLRGEAYAFVATPAPGRGEPEQIWPIPANMIEPLPSTLRPSLTDPQHWVVDYSYDPDTSRKPLRLPGENVVHFRFPNPWDFWRGLAPLTAGYLPARTDRRQADWLLEWYGPRNARPSFIASVPRDTLDDEFDIAEADFYESFEKGLGTAFTRAGDLTVQVISQTLEQMKLLEAREFNQQEIDRIYGVPAGLHGESMSGDSRQAADTILAENVIQPLLDLEANFWTGSVQRFWGREFVVAAPSVVPRDRALEMQEYAIVGRDRTIAENRAEMEMSALELPPELTFIVEQVPVRLLEILARTGQLFALGPGPDGGEATPQAAGASGETEPAGAPAVGGQPSPGAVAGTEAARGWSPGGLPGLSRVLALPDPDAAVEQAIRLELGRWRKVAVREAAKGRDPAARAFESDLLPPVVAAAVTAKLAEAGADREKVAEVFRLAVARFTPDSGGDGGGGDLDDAPGHGSAESREAPMSFLWRRSSGDDPLGSYVRPALSEEEAAAMRRAMEEHRRAMEEHRQAVEALAGTLGAEEI